MKPLSSQRRSWPPCRWPQLDAAPTFATTGKGSEFAISLPRVRRNEDAPFLAPAPPTASSSQGARILLVDDNEDGAVVMADALTQLGHEVRVACDGPSALHLAEQFTPNVALLDIGLPVMDGYELAARLRELPSFAGVSLVALTGYGEPSAVQRCREAGFAPHLVKPVELTRLQEVVRATTVAP